MIQITASYFLTKIYFDGNFARVHFERLLTSPIDAVELPKQVSLMSFSFRRKHRSKGEQQAAGDGHHAGGVGVFKAKQGGHGDRPEMA